MANKIVTSPKLMRHQSQHHTRAVTGGDLDPINAALQDLKIDDSSLRMISINLGCGSPRSTVGERRPTAELVVRSEYPHILFAQEIMAPSKSLWKLALDHDLFDWKNSGDEAGILWDKRELDLKEEIPSERKSSITSKMSEGSWSRDSVSDIASRTSVVCLKLKTASQYIIAISWHGPWRMGEEGKVETCRALQEFALKVRDKYFKQLVPFPGIVIGGDFNLPLESTDDALLPGFRLSSYEPSIRRRARVGDGTIDFFLHTKEVTLKDTCALEMSVSEGSSFTREEVDATTEERLHAMDHDPIKAYLVFTPSVYQGSN